MNNYKNEIMKQYKITDFEKYNENFDIEIIIRGDNLYKEDKISNLKVIDNKYSCKIQGTEKYNLSIEFDQDNNIKNMKCSCPYFEKGNNCKHLYALLIEAKLKDNYPILIKLRNDKFLEFKNNFNSYKRYFYKNTNKYTSSDIDKIAHFIDYYENARIPRYNVLTSRESTQNGYFNVICELESELNEMKTNFLKLKSNEQEVVKTKTKTKTSGLMFGFLSGIIKGLSSKSPQQLREEEIKKMALDEFDKGNPEPYISEYNELEDYMFQDYDMSENDIFHDLD